MGYRKYITILAFVLGIQCAKAQQNAFQVADSTSDLMYKAGNWKELINFGNQAIANGSDFPGLRIKMAYAFFVSENYKAALDQYDIVLSKDSYNQTARYFAYYCNKYLNNEPAASYNASYLDSETLSKENLKSTGLIDLGFETGFKFADNTARGNGFYSRVGISNRLSWRWQLEQSVAYFNQDIYTRVINSTFNNFIAQSDRQTEYFIKLSYAVNSNLTLLGSYHYLNTGYLNATYHSNLGLAGVKYAGKYIDLQADMNFGSIVKQHNIQYNAKLTYYPLGNLNLYTISRGSLKHISSQNQFIFNQALGFKLVKDTWLESSVTFGSLENYADADGLYIYNSIDNTKFKFGQTAFYQLGLHALVQLNYTYEQKADAYQAINYNQHSITAGIVWKF